MAAGALVAVFGLQIAYKLLTGIAVRNALRNPVVVANLGIALLHGITVVTLLPSL